MSEIKSETHEEIRAHDGVVPKMSGADIELGNMIVGGWDRGYSNQGAAARAVLAEIHGFSRTPVWRYEPTSPGNYGYDGGERKYESVGESAASGYYEWAQDRGRKFLGNGGCAYLDMEHCEIALPETLSAFDHVAAHGAMLRIVREAMGRANDRLPQGQTIKVMVNNGNGVASWGSHLNILLTRRAWDNIFARKLHHLLFLASFQSCAIVLTGAGKVGGDRGWPARYQISARADFLGEGGIASSATVANRPLVNSRDEPLAGRQSNLARLHCIFFDSTLCQVATLLRVGMMQVICCMLEQGQIPTQLILDDPTEALRAWSRDPALKRKAALIDGSQVTAVDLLRAIFEQAKRFVDAGRAEGLVADVGRIMTIWESCLTALKRRDWDFLAGRIDWVAKMRLLESAASKRGIAWDAPEMRFLDFTYSSLGSEGLYRALERAGAVQKVVSDGAVERFVHEPPENTRAWLRGYAIRHAPRGLLDDVDWDMVRVRQERVAADGWSSYSYPELSMGDPLSFTRGQCQEILESAPSLVEGLRALGLGSLHDSAAPTGNAKSNAIVSYNAEHAPGWSGAPGKGD